MANDAYDNAQTDREILTRLRKEEWVGFSIAVPQAEEHEHWCDECRDAWAHAPAEECGLGAVYECPAHQPRGGISQKGPAGDREDS